MSDERELKRQLHVIRLGDLRADTIYDRWEGGDDVGRMIPCRREAVLDRGPGHAPRPRVIHGVGGRAGVEEGAVAQAYG